MMEQMQFMTAPAVVEFDHEEKIAAYLSWADANPEKVDDRQREFMEDLEEYLECVEDLDDDQAYALDFIIASNHIDVRAWTYH